MLPALLFSSEKTLPHPSTLYTENPLVRKYLVCAIPQNITDRDAESIYVLLQRRPVARPDECKLG